jgi:FMN-dependent NADH-azoreductase
MRLLHVAASPRGESSESLQIANTFLSELRNIRPEVVVDTWNLWDGTLPEFGTAAAAAKMAIFAGADPAGEEAMAWARVRAAFTRLTRADYYLFSVPMWNHGIPYVLKQLIDVVSQPGLLFAFDPQNGYTGLLTGKKAVVVYTSAVYGDGHDPRFGVDFQAPYFNEWLRWAGVSDVSEVYFRPNLVTADADVARQIAHAAAREAAKAL